MGWGGSSSGGSDALTNSSTWSDLQNQEANYVYNPNDPDAWSRLQGQMANYMTQTGGAGGGGDWKNKLTSAIGALGSGKGSDKTAPPPEMHAGYAPAASSTFHQGAPASGLSYGLQDIANLMKIKGLLGV